MEAALLGVQFAEMVLRVMPRGPQAVEAADGIDALESLQFRSAVDLLYNTSNAASATLLSLDHSAFEERILV